jgi:hypothetical protein
MINITDTVVIGHTASVDLQVNGVKMAVDSVNRAMQELLDAVENILLLDDEQGTASWELKQSEYKAAVEKLKRSFDSLPYRIRRGEGNEYNTNYVIHNMTKRTEKFLKLADGVVKQQFVDERNNTAGRESLQIPFDEPEDTVSSTMQMEPTDYTESEDLFVGLRAIIMVEGIREGHVGYGTPLYLRGGSDEVVAARFVLEIQCAVKTIRKTHGPLWTARELNALGGFLVLAGKSLEMTYLRLSADDMDFLIKLCYRHPNEYGFISCMLIFLARSMEIERGGSRLIAKLSNLLTFLTFQHGGGPDYYATALTSAWAVCIERMNSKAEAFGLLRQESAFMGAFTELLRRKIQNTFTLDVNNPQDIEIITGGFVFNEYCFNLLRDRLCRDQDTLKTMKEYLPFTVTFGDKKYFLEDSLTIDRFLSIINAIKGHKGSVGNTQPVKHARAACEDSTASMRPMKRARV